MDILGASGSEAFSVFCYCEGYENTFYVVFMFSLCGIIYISVGVLMTNNTIFDDVFRTMVEKMTYLVVPLINEVFHTSYPEDVKIVHLRNEHQMEDGELITDARLLIGDKVYHIECQSVDDTTMSIRMFEYDLAIALENRRKVGRRFFVEFPRSCVIYLRTTRNTPDVEEVELLFPDGQVCVYRVPTVKLERYTKDSIFEKNLLLLLPFYVMRYEDAAHTIGEDSEKLQGLLKEYEDIRINLEKELSTAGRSELYTDLNKLIIRISNYIFREEEKVRKGVDEVMGGKVLQLESERLREEGMAIGKAEGKAEGEARLSALINRLILEGRSDEIQKVVTDVNRRQELYSEYKL